MHVGKDDLDVGLGGQGIFFGCAGDETGDTTVSSLMIGLDAVSETAIHYELTLSDVVTTFRTTGFGLEIVECKDLSFP